MKSVFTTKRYRQLKRHEAIQTSLQNTSKNLNALSQTLQNPKMVKAFASEALANMENVSDRLRTEQKVVLKERFRKDLETSFAQATQVCEDLLDQPEKQASLTDRQEQTLHKAEQIARKAESDIADALQNDVS